jgi:hypothetical protein
MCFGLNLPVTHRGKNANLEKSKTLNGLDDSWLSIKAAVLIAERIGKKCFFGKVLFRKA